MAREMVGRHIQKYHKSQVVIGIAWAIKLTKTDFQLFECVVVVIIWAKQAASGLTKVQEL